MDIYSRIMSIVLNIPFSLKGSVAYTFFKQTCSRYEQSCLYIYKPCRQNLITIKIVFIMKKVLTKSVFPLKIYFFIQAYKFAENLYLINDKSYILKKIFKLQRLNVGVVKFISRVYIIHFSLYGQFHQHLYQCKVSSCPGKF